MQTIDFDGKTLSNSFQSALTSSAQFIKPLVIVDFQDGRHLSNVTITTNDAHPDSNTGNIGYFFNKDQVVNGIEYETFAWGVASAKDNYGKTITANGKYYAMPTDLSDEFKYGWWSNTTSNSTGLFTTNPYLDINFDATTVNKIKIVTSRELGQIKSLTLAVSRSNSATVLNETITFDSDNNEFERIINLNDTYTDISRVLVTVVSTKNPNDYARILSVSPLYQVDISDYVVNVSNNRVRDLHETSLPISGTSQSSAEIAIDNTSKKFNISNTSSEFGKFLQKDIKVNISYGWKAYSSNNVTVSSFITANVASSGDTHIYLNNATEFPNGDTANTNLETNYYIVTIDKGNFKEEKVLVKKKATDLSLEIQERGYGNTTAVAHTSGATITFDPFEYVEIGTFFVEEVTSSAGGMDVSLVINDQLKFLNDKILQKGYFRDNTTVGDAVQDLLFYGNYPNHKIIKFDRFQDSPTLNNGILHFKFNDESNNSSNTYVAPGLRYRIYQPPSGSESSVKDMQLDVNERELSDLDKALGMSASVSPSFVGVKSNVNLSAYNLVSDASSLNNKFYQGVFDGYYIPITSGTDVEIGFEVDEGGARLYIDDNLVINGWNEVTSPTYYSTTYTFTSGIPYKIRLEFYHTGNVDAFSLVLMRGGNAPAYIIDSTELLTNVILDSIGSRDASYTGSNRNKQRNNIIPTAFVALNNNSSISWNIQDKSVYLSNTAGNTSVVSSYMRLPYHESWNVTSTNSNPYGSWAIEFIVKFPDGGLGASGEYISNYSNASPTSGIEYFYISSSVHGVNIKTYDAGTNSVGTISLSSATLMPEPTGWNHIVTTYNSSTKVISYYVDGILHASTTVPTNYVPRFGTRDLTFGGRGALFVNGSGAIAPTSTVSAAGINVYFDEFIIYRKAMSSSDVLKRYRETQIQEIKRFPFLYGLNETIYQTILNISFADFGRIYVDEKNNARYDHYYAFFESSIDQHANVQKTISDSNSIIDANIVKNLQVNSVVVKIAGVVSTSNQVQAIWRAPDSTTLGVIKLTSNISNTANTIPASSFDIIPFPQSGYIIIDSEIIKYNNKDKFNFLSAERGVLGTSAASHNANTLVREVRYFNFEYDKSPAFNVKNPFITGILFEDPDEINILHWSASPFKGNLIISASENVDSNTVVFAEGTNPVTNKVAFTSVAGIPVQVTENKTQVLEQKAINSQNRRRYGLKEIVIDSPFITDATQGQLLADFIINKLSEPIPIMEIQTTLMPTLQVGDRIRISSFDQLGIINTDYWVISISSSVGSSYSQSMMLRKVV